MQKSAQFCLPDFSKVDLGWFNGAIKCPVVGKPLVQSSVISCFCII